MSKAKQQQSLGAFITRTTTAAEGAETKEVKGETTCEPDLSYTQVTSISSWYDMDQLLPPKWHNQLKDEFTKPYWSKLCASLESRSTTETIFPPRNEVLRAFSECDFDQVKVVIIGQDPYHDVGQAEGLCFSVKRGVAIPKSLYNIFTELESDIPGFKRPSHGSLIDWAKQGVFLLNTTLTVKAHEANSHKDLGWDKFTEAAISKLATNGEHIVWMAWGNYAQKLCSKVPASRHKVLKSGHPSPLSIKYFKGCKHFSQCNEYLKSKGKPEIEWKVKD